MRRNAGPVFTDGTPLPGPRSGRGCGGGGAPPTGRPAGQRGSHPAHLSPRSSQLASGDMGPQCSQVPTGALPSPEQPKESLRAQWGRAQWAGAAPGPDSQWPGLGWACGGPAAPASHQAGSRAPLLRLRSAGKVQGFGQASGHSEWTHADDTQTRRGRQASTAGHPPDPTAPVPSAGPPVWTAPPGGAGGRGAAAHAAVHSPSCKRPWARRWVAGDPCPSALAARARTIESYLAEAVRRKPSKRLLQKSSRANSSASSARFPVSRWRKMSPNARSPKVSTANSRRQPTSGTTHTLCPGPALRSPDL